MSKPRRIQLSRKKGWRKPDNCVVVARPTRWGNPFRVVPYGKSWGALEFFALGGSDNVVSGFKELFDNPHDARAKAVALYQVALADGQLEPDLALLRGKDLACWCPLDQPCHADVLLEIANAGDEQ